MKKKHIAIFAEKLHGGGVEKILQIICRNFDYKKYDLTVFSSKAETIPEGCYPSRIKPSHYFSSGNGLLAKIENKIKLLVYYHTKPAWFYTLFIRRHFDIGIAFIEGYATRILSGGPSKMQKIAWVHTDLEKNHWTTVSYRNQEEERSCYNNLKKIVCVSKTVEEKFQNTFGISNTMIIHNPIEIENIERKSLERNILPPNKGIRIISIGSLIPVKGYSRLINVAECLLSEGYEFELIILGEGYERKKLEDMILEKNLKSHVILMGFQNNPYPILRSADIYVCSSIAEGFNTAISEAIILGKPVVSTEISGVREQLGMNSEFGIITENSENGLLNGLREMLNPEKIAFFKEQSLKRKDLFNLDNQMQKIYNLIES